MAAGWWSRGPIDLVAFSVKATRCAAVLVALGVVLAVAGLTTTGAVVSIAAFALLVAGALGAVVVFACLWSEQTRPLPAAGQPGSTAAEQRQLRRLLLEGSRIEPQQRPAAGVLAVRNLARTTSGRWVEVMFIESSAAQIVSNDTNSALRIISGVLVVAFLAVFIRGLWEARRWRRAVANPTLAEYGHTH